MYVINSYLTVIQCIISSSICIFYTYPWFTITTFKVNFLSFMFLTSALQKIEATTHQNCFKEKANYQENGFQEHHGPRGWEHFTLKKIN